MLNFQGIDHISLSVKNLKESVKFYSELFGFELKEEGSGMNGDPYAIVGKSNVGVLCMYQKENFETNDKKNLFHFGFNVENFKEAWRKLKELGAKVVYYSPSGVVDYENSKSIYIQDPSGYEIEITQNFAGKL